MNKGMFGYPDKRRYKNFYGFPRKRLLKPSMRNFPKRNDDYDFLVEVTSIPLTVSLLYNTLADTSSTLDWGDGTPNDILVGNGISVNVAADATFTFSGITISHTYYNYGIYNLKFITGSENIITLSFNFGTNILTGIFKEDFAIRFPQLESIRFSGQSQNISGQLPFNFSFLNFLYFDIAYFNNLYGDFPNVDNWTKLKYLRIGGTSSGNTSRFTSIPSFNNCINLVYFYAAFLDYINPTELLSFNNCSNLYYFNIAKSTNINSGFIGSMPSFSNCTKLNTFSCQYQNFDGEQPSFNTCVALSFLNLYTYITSFTNSFPSLSNCVNLNNIYIGRNNSSAKSYTSDVMFDVSTLTSLNSVNMSNINTTWVNPTFYCVFNGNLSLRYCINISGTLIAYGTVNNLWIDYTNITYIDFTNLTVTQGITLPNVPCDMEFPLGTKILIGDNGLASNATFTITSCGISLTNLDNTINNLYTYRTSFNAVAKTFVAAGTNPAPSGTYQAPSGYIQATTGVSGNDGSPASAKEQVYVLVNQNNNNTTIKKYNWAFTIN